MTQLYRIMWHYTNSSMDKYQLDVLEKDFIQHCKGGNSTFPSGNKRAPLQTSRTVGQRRQWIGG